MTHQELTKYAVKWLQGHGYSVALAELRNISGEEPDALGLSSGDSCLIECKTSRADFLADKKKWHRRNPKFGMGTWRYMLCPKGLLSPDEMPEGWGLLEVRGSRVYKIKGATMFDKAMAGASRTPVGVLLAPAHHPGRARATG